MALRGAEVIKDNKFPVLHDKFYGLLALVLFHCPQLVRLLLAGWLALKPWECRDSICGSPWFFSSSSLPFAMHPQPPVMQSIGPRPLSASGKIVNWWKGTQEKGKHEIIRLVEFISPPWTVDQVNK